MIVDRFASIGGELTIIDNILLIHEHHEREWDEKSECEDEKPASPWPSR